MYKSCKYVALGRIYKSAPTVYGILFQQPHVSPPLRCMKYFFSNLTFALLLLAISSANSQSSQPDWVDSRYGYFAKDRALQEVISDFASELKLPVMISPAVAGIVNGDFPTMKAIDFLSTLARVYRLMWFYDGTVLHIYSTREVKEEIIPLAANRMTDIEATFKELNVIGTHYHWQIIPNRNRIELSGPPRFIELMEAVIGSAEEKPLDIISTLPPLDDHIVKIFKLKYIYASSDSQRKTLDIAQLLGRIMDVGYYVTEGGGDAVKKPQDVQKLLGSGLSPSYGENAAADNDGKEQPASESKSPAAQPPKSDGAYIIVDTRLNMVIVRDQAKRIPLYEALINQLDKPLDQIEIEVLILDINDDATNTLGIEWNYESGDFAYSQGGVSITEMSAAQSRQFRIELEALETQGKANISARPSVLTLDNHEAEFSNQQTFYVKLGAQSAESQAVDLVPITYGATLKVKPHVIHRDKEAHQILLTLDIQDGRQASDDQRVDGVPAITNSTIKTQAMVSNGKSLLIGGYKVNHEAAGYRGVPVLGYLPVVGLLFRVQNRVSLDTRRYFLISPRLVDSEVVFKSDVDAAEILKRDDKSQQDRYGQQPKPQQKPRPNNQPPQNSNRYERTHSGPP